MDMYAKRVEIIANVAILCSAVLGSSILVANYFHRTPYPYAPTPSVLSEGSHIQLAEIDWRNARHTLLFCLSTTCYACSENADVYRRIITATQRTSSTRIIAIVPQDIATGRGFLSDINIPISEILSLPLYSLGVRRTPALILLDHTGTVMHIWSGSFSTQTASEVLSLLQ